MHPKNRAVYSPTITEKKRRKIVSSTMCYCIFQLQLEILLDFFNCWLFNKVSKKMLENNLAPTLSWPLKIIKNHYGLLPT